MERAKAARPQEAERVASMTPCSLPPSLQAAVLTTFTYPVLYKKYRDIYLPILHPSVVCMLSCLSVALFLLVPTGRPFAGQTDPT